MRGKLTLLLLTGIVMNNLVVYAQGACRSDSCGSCQVDGCLNDIIQAANTHAAQISSYCADELKSTIVTPIPTSYVPHCSGNPRSLSTACYCYMSAKYPSQARVQATSTTSSTLTSTTQKSSSSLTASTTSKPSMTTSVSSTSLQSPPKSSSTTNTTPKNTSSTNSITPKTPSMTTTTASITSTKTSNPIPTSTKTSTTSKTATSTTTKSVVTVSSTSTISHSTTSVTSSVSPSKSTSTTIILSSTTVKSSAVTSGSSLTTGSSTTTSTRSSVTMSATTTTSRTVAPSTSTKPTPITSSPSSPTTTSKSISTASSPSSPTTKPTTATSKSISTTSSPSSISTQSITTKTTLSTTVSTSSTTSTKPTTTISTTRLATGTFTTTTASTATTATTVTTTGHPYPTDGSYTPPSPPDNDYSDCYAPDPSTEPFRLFDVGFIDIVNINGVPGTTDVQYTNENAPYWTFEPRTYDSGFFDMMFHDGNSEWYLGITDEDKFVFVNQSSWWEYISQDWNGTTVNSVTSIWTPTCDGILYAGLDGGYQVNFEVIDGFLVAEPVLQKRFASDEINVEIGLVSWIRGQYGSVHKRCPPQDFEISRPRSDAPNNSFNGCGPEGGRHYLHHIGKADWLSCCNDHDLCYGDCISKFETCNQNLGNCIRQICGNAYPGDSFSLARTGCYIAANIFQGAVSSPLGGKAFRAATDARCECSCPPDHTPCGCNTTDYSNSPLFYKNNPYPEDDWSDCKGCCGAWADQVYNGSCTCCMFDWQYMDPGNDCCSPDYYHKCCWVGCGRASDG